MIREQFCHANGGHTIGLDDGSRTTYGGAFRSSKMRPFHQIELKGEDDSSKRGNHQKSAQDFADFNEYITGFKK
uniref:Uncharacterized protein n=1 Tax=Musa acuminata subsp. malaccensis TaxID=214687 RepID=A0A804IM14_MUSAM